MHAKGERWYRRWIIRFGFPLRRPKKGCPAFVWTNVSIKGTNKPFRGSIGFQQSVKQKYWVNFIFPGMFFFFKVVYNSSHPIDQHNKLLMPRIQLFLIKLRRVLIVRLIFFGVGCMKNAWVPRKPKEINFFSLSHCTFIHRPVFTDAVGTTDTPPLPSSMHFLSREIFMGESLRAVRIDAALPDRCKFRWFTYVMPVL